MTGGLILQWLLKYNFSVAVWVGMVVYLREALNRRSATGTPLRHEDIEAAVIEGAVHSRNQRSRLLTTVTS